MPSIPAMAPTVRLPPSASARPEHHARSAPCETSAPPTFADQPPRNEQTQERHDHDGNHPIVLWGPRRTSKRKNGAARKAAGRRQCGLQRARLERQEEFPIRRGHASLRIVCHQPARQLARQGSHRGPPYIYSVNSRRSPAKVHIELGTLLCQSALRCPLGNARKRILRSPSTLLRRPGRRCR